MGQDDSDSDDDQDMNKCQVEMKNDAAPADQFALDDDIDDEEDDDLNADAIAANWVTTSSQDANPEEDAGQDAENDEDDLWGAAKKEAEASKALEADRAKREEKMIAEANMAMQKRMEEAQALGKEVRAKREEEAANEARRVEEQEREAENARNVAREKALQEVNDVKNTIDLDAQRELMKQYEQEFNDNYSAGASPSSDFGFQKHIPSNIFIVSYLLWGQLLSGRLFVRASTLKEGITMAKNTEQKKKNAYNILTNNLVVYGVTCLTTVKQLQPIPHKTIKARDKDSHTSRNVQGMPLIG